MCTKKIDVVLLCGGIGERLRPLTKSIPKPLLIVNKKPFLYHLIWKLKSHSEFGNIILASGYKSHLIKSFVKKYFYKYKNIKIVDSGNVDIIQRLKDCSIYIKRDFLICYGDTFVDIDLHKYISYFYKKTKKKLLGGLVSQYFQVKFGMIEFNKKTFIVNKFLEKPILKNPINLGYFIFKNKTLLLIKKSYTWHNFLSKISNSKKLYNFITNKKFFAFDTPREYNEIKTTFI
jgi:NDP-sugar pyrophosphorylase family protein